MAEAERTLGQVLRWIRQRLADAGVSGSGFEARLLLEAVSGHAAADILARPALPVTPAMEERLEECVRRRAAGEPLHRILGWREFYGLRLALSPETLEPRPDTETLVDAVLPFVRERVKRSGSCGILDLGTGTGAIALALLSQVPEASAVGVDIAEGALRTAAANARSLGLDGRFQPLRSDWFEDVSGRFALIVSNPPYISHDELAALDFSVSGFDPPGALDGGVDGLDAYRTLARRTPKYLEPDGLLALEIGHLQRNTVTGLFGAAGFALREARRDYGGNERVLLFGLPEIAANP